MADLHDDHEPLIPVPQQAFDAYWPIAPLGHWLIIFLIGIGVLSVVSVGSMLVQDRLLAQIEQGVQVPEEVAEASDTRQLVLSMLELGVIASTGTLFLIWFSRAHRNLPSFGVRDLRYTPGWAIGGFFVPLLNLVRPYQVMKEVWWGSDPDLNPGDGAVPRRGAVLVRLWWGAYLLMNFLSMAAVQLMFRRSDAPGDLRVITQVDIASSLLTIVAVILAAGVVREVSMRQSVKRELTMPTPN